MSANAASKLASTAPTTSTGGTRTGKTPRSNREARRLKDVNSAKMSAGCLDVLNG